MNSEVGERASRQAAPSVILQVEEVVKMICYKQMKTCCKSSFASP